MRQALAEVCADESLRADLDAAFYKIADFIRNTEPGGTTRPHPGRPREHQGLDDGGLAASAPSGHRVE